MLSKTKWPFERPEAEGLRRRLQEPRRFLQVVAGPRQVGKSTLVHQVVEDLGVPIRYVSADAPTLKGAHWIRQQWEAARLECDGEAGGLLVLDEVQKIPHWSEVVKELWDEDTRRACPLKVVVLGSAPLLIAKGLTESLAGRFEVTHLFHWSWPEMRGAFGWDLDTYLFFGGYPGAAPLVGEVERWRRYVLDSLIETTISRDLLLTTRVDKPALLRRLFELACLYSGQVLSYSKMLGQLLDAGNTTTLAHYLELLAGAGMVGGLPKFAGDQARQRGSSPKLQVFNTAHMSALTQDDLASLKQQPDRWGRWVESAVGAHLWRSTLGGSASLHHWRHGHHEVDFVWRRGARVVAIEVKSGAAPLAHPGTAAFTKAFAPDRCLLVGGDGIPLADFLGKPPEAWLL